ncbi:MAG: KH domain-containing protein [Clostridia bacterium]|nr:KH domain-containing protein [Clostridia bacterium]MBR2160255.1 KH domain-containing protein [Clostridia bacterium]MBR2324206.1 KH domain-containing protein [Clostridia bacterium]MBR2397856.1 KH domain-containing protein [Clostridia bacterium]MBR2496263.1 KH domain-containing protein [Clostridia bacterium]
MKELVEYLVKQFVPDPENVVVEENATEDAVVLTVKLPSDDMGKVIGKQGKIAKAIRTIVKAASSKENLKYLVEITEIDG